MAFSSLSVVIPCYKEAEVIEANVLSIARYLKECFRDFEIIVVTDGSPDGTERHVKRLQATAPDIPLTLISFPYNQGKGAAVRAGVLASRFDPILFLDADLTVSIEELGKFLLALENADLVIGSRLISGAYSEEPTPWYRIVLARGFHVLQMLLLGNFEFPDTQCGFKLFRRDVALKLFQQLTVQRFAFDAELLFLAKKQNARIATLPIMIKKDPRNTNVRPLRDSANMLFALLKVRWNDMAGRYAL